MATSYTYPGVYIQELQSAVHPITGVATSIAAFVGYTLSGIDNRAQQIFSFPDFERLYGGLASNSELSYTVQQFFQNNGSQAYVVRTPGLSVGAAAATVGFGAFTFEALSSGTAANGNLLIDVDYIGLTANSTTGDPKTFNLTVTEAAGGNSEYFPSVTLDNTKSNFIQTIVDDPDNGSQLVNISAVNNALLTPPMAQTGVVGTAVTPYSVAAALCGTTTITGTVSLTQGSSDVQGTGGTTFTSALKFGQWVTFSSDGTNTPYQIQAIKSDTDLTLSQNYAGATAAGGTLTVPKTQATANFGLALNTTHPTPAPSGLPITVPVVAQNAIVPQSLSGLATLLQSAINSVLTVQVPGATAVVTVTSLTGAAGGQALRINALLPNYPDAVLSLSAPAAASGLSDISTPLGIGGGATANVAHYALGTNHVWASQTASKPGTDGGLPATADLIGDPAAFTGIYALQKVDLFNLLCIPEATRANPSDPNALDVSVNPNAIYGAAIALCNLRRAMLLIDSPPDVNTVAAAVDWKTSGLTVVDPNGAAFFPRLRLPDPLNGYQLRTFAPCGVVAGVYATTDSNRRVWKAPAGTAATLGGVQSMVYKLSDAENGVLNPLGLNCFRTFPVYGPILWGARTLVGADAMASQWKYVPVRRTALFIEQSLYNGTQWVVFEPNDEPLWAAIRLNVGSFMQGLFLKGAFQGSTPAQAYFVKCDSETTTQADIDLGIVNILVGFAPLQPAEFVVIQIEQMTGQSQS
jgi:Bacteriophage tail sheath protein